MAAPLDRTWFNTLIDDDGSGALGTVWNKAQIDGLLDTIDAALVPVVDKTGAPVAGQLSLFNDADTVKGDPALTYDNVNGVPRVVLQYPASTTKGRALAAIPDWLGWSINANFTGSAWERDDAAKEGYFVFLTPSGFGVQRITTGGTQELLLRTVARTLDLPYGQIKFPVAAVPSADPNTLDDYRELTFTPSFTSSGGASGQTYSLRSGYAVKIGGMVFASGRVILSTLGTFSGNLRIGGLPFACAFLNHQVSGSVGLFSGLVTSLASMTLTLQPGTSAADIWGTVGGGGTTVVQLGQANITAAFDVAFSLAYPAA